ncbi:MAG: hypothetical protein LH471_09995 [Salinibacterium sp.]|nr:hypothetical protein [Salinibacterium sp.]
MSVDPDEDALAWAGDDDPSLAVGAKASRRAASAEAETAPTGRQIPGVLLVTYGVLGGIYLIYTFGWLLSLQRLIGVRGVSSDPLTEIMFQFGAFLALAGPTLWFAATFLLTRGQKPLSRLAWLLVGLLAVLPWSFILGAWAR